MRISRVLQLLIAEAHERHSEEQRLIDELRQPPLIGQSRMLQPELGEDARLAIDKRLDAELLSESLQLAR